MAPITQLARQDGIEITIPSRNNWVSLIAMPIVLLFVPCLVYGGYLAFSNDMAVKGVLTLVGAATIAIRATMTIAWCFFGKEVIRISNGQLVWVRQACGIGPSKPFAMQGITNIRVNKRQSKLSLRYPSPWNTFWGRVSFDCDGYVHNLALKVSDAQAAELVAALSPYLAPSHVQPQTVESPASAAPASPTPVETPFPPPIAVAVKAPALPPDLPSPAPAQPVFIAERAVYCIHCGAQNSSQDRFCGQCGRDIAPAPVQPAPDNPPALPPHNPPAATPLPVPPPPPIPPPLPASTATDRPGSMMQRLGAFFADIALVCVATRVAIYILTRSGYLDADVSELIEQGRFGFTQIAIWVAYMVFAQSAYRTTIGKYVFGLELASSRERNAKPEFGSILLRETIGKFCSCVVVYAGLIRAFWDPRKQTWHDQMADTIVRQRATNPSLRKQLLALVAAAVLLCTGAGVYSGWKAFVKEETESAAQEFKSAVEECTAAGERAESVGSLIPQNWTERQERDRTMLVRANEYDTKIAAVTDVLHRILRNQFYASHSEFLYYVYQQKAYNLVQERNRKLKDALQLILSTSPEQADYQNKLSTVTMMDSEIEAINKQIEQLDQQWRDTSSQEEESPL